MHDTASQIGTLAMHIYADVAGANILEVGSLAVNGSLRKNAYSTTNYVGIDIQDGAGVDIVVEPGKPFPVEDNAFDLVLASSVFEHDPMFWVTFEEMCRKTKEGGFIYINAPSNGVVHRYPQDSWRFYPDAAKSLAGWASRQGQNVSLVESFTAPRQSDIWNDFVAVFRKGRIVRRMPSIFIHDHVPGWNISTWRSNEIINPRDETEDMALLADARREVEAIVHSRDEAVEARDVAIMKLAEITGQLQLSQDTQAEMSERHAAVLAGLMNQREEEGKAAAALLAEANATAERTAREATAKLAQATDRLKVTEYELSERITVLTTRDEEIAKLCAILRETEVEKEAARDDAEWLKSIIQQLVTQPSGWHLVPQKWRDQRIQNRLRDAGLFDGQAYLARNPDVAAARMDPFQHYLVHGLVEGRSRSLNE